MTRNGWKEVAGVASAVLVTFCMVGVAAAVPNLGNLQTVFDDYTTAPVAGDSSVDVYTDMLPYDAYWSLGGTGTSAATIVIELAGYAASNTFGIYDPYTRQQVTIFGGSAVQGDQSAVSMRADGSVLINNIDTGVHFTANLFGFFLGVPELQTTFYSDTALNADALDHMLAYAGEGDTFQIPGLMAGPWGPNEYALCWEDLTGLGDADYDDMVVMVESVNPVPEPGTMILLGSGLVGLGALRRRKARK